MSALRLPGDMRVGSIIEIDRTHLACARMLPVEARRFAAKVTDIALDVEPAHVGWQYVTAYSDKRNSKILVGIPPAAATGSWVGPKVRVIRR